MMKLKKFHFLKKEKNEKEENRKEWKIIPIVCIGLFLGFFLFGFLLQIIHYLHYLYSEYGFITIIICIMIAFVCIGVMAIVKYIIDNDLKFLEKILNILVVGYTLLGITAALGIIILILLDFSTL